MTPDGDEVTKTDVPPICKLCGRVKYQRVASHNVAGQGAVLVSYWLCETCDTGQPSRARA